MSCNCFASRTNEMDIVRKEEEQSVAVEEEASRAV